MVRDMSIRTRLMLAFLVLLGLLAAVAAVSLHRIDGVTATTQRLVDTQARRVFIAQSMNQHAQSAAAYLLKLLHTAERDKRVPLYAAMDEQMHASNQAVEALGRTRPEADIQADMEHLIEMQKLYAERMQETVEMIELQSPEQARLHFESRTQKVLDTLLFDTEALQTRLRQTMQTEMEMLRDAAARAKQLVVWLALGAVVLGAVLARQFARGVVEPVQEAVAVAQAIASGDYQQAVPSGRGDEVGALLRALRVMRDSISSREEKILRLAYIDPLTDLPNRTRFNALFDARPPQASGALVLVDIDRFAPINNALGHAVGDRLLCAIATRIQSAIPPGSLAARLQGDQFMLMLDGADKATALQHAQQVLAALRAPMTVGQQRLDMDASVGLVCYPADGSDITTLLRRADLAMASAKRRQDHVAFGSDIPDEPPHEQLSLIGEMGDALRNGEFVLYYQPKLNLQRNRITAAEALIRWRHPVKGLVPPLRFMPFAEQTGFIREITPWVLRQTIADAAQWVRGGLEVVASANLSTLDLLNPSLVRDIQRLLAEAALPPEQLCLEITESALLDEPELALKHLGELSRFGLKLSIDDYGTGQSSLAYVKTLPVDELKIDRTFVTGVDVNPKNAAIVRSTVVLCRELGLSVVAEGAETPEELAWLRANHCDLVQGYGVAKPMPLDAFIAWATSFNQQQREPDLADRAA